MSREPTIPRKGVSEPSVAVHRPSYTEPSSSSQPHPHPEESQHEQHQNDEQSNEPPPYSGPTSSSMTPTRPTAPQAQPTYPGLPRLNYSLYTLPTFALSEDQKTLTSHSPELSIYPAKLTSLIQSLATVPPKPQIRIIGKSANGVVDFDVRINLMNLIVPEEGKSGNGRMNYVKVIGKGELGFRGEGKEAQLPDLRSLEEWARRYCEDQSSIKRFVLERTVINWDISYLEGRLLSLISSTSYRGHVTLSFPLTHSRVVVHSPDKVNRFFSDVTKLFTGTKKYEVIKSVWPYADVARNENGGAGRRCAVQEEEVWFADWRDAIRHAIVAKRKGWVTVEDRLEFLMEPKLGETDKPEDWGSF